MPDSAPRLVYRQPLPSDVQRLFAIFGDPQHPYTRKLLAAVPVPDPARRGERHALPDDEIRSPIRAPDYVAPERIYREVSPGHVVQEWDGDRAVRERPVAAA